MATMFIQLRRVVYLLVLMQCCACVVYASSSRGTGGVTEEPKKGLDDIEPIDHDRELTVLKRVATETLNDVERVTKEGRSCLAVWKNVVEVNEEAVAHARAGIDEIAGLIKQIKEKANATVQPLEVGGVGKKKKVVLKLKKDVQAEELKELLVKVKEALAKERKEPMKLVAAFERAGHTKQVCSTYRRNIDDVIGKVDRSLVGFKSYEAEIRDKPDMRKLEEECKGAHEYLPKLRGDMTSQELNATRAWQEARDNVTEWRKALETLNEIGTMTADELSAVKEELDKIKEASQKEKEKIEGPKAKREHPNSGVEVRADAGDVKRTSREADAIKEINENITAQFDVQEKLMKEEKKRIAQEKARKAAEEEARRRAEEERRRIEEEAVRAEEERKKQEKLAEEEKVRKAEEEKERQAAEKVREEEAKRAAEKVREVEAKRAAEKVKNKKKDGSSSPALVQSPLLLLLLSVLGCTLVC